MLLTAEPTNYLSTVPTRDRISCNQKGNIIHIIQCPGFHNDCVSKKNRIVITRLSEHGKNEDQPMFQHFGCCEEFDYKLNVYSLEDLFSDS